MLFSVLTSMRIPNAGGPAFEFRWHHQHSGCPVLRVLCEGREPETLAQVRLRRRRLKRNPRPAFIHSHWSGLVQEIETITAPPPILRRTHQSALYRIPMHVPQFFDPLLRRPHVEVVETRLPERRARESVSEQPALAWVRPFLLGQQGAGGALF